MREKQKRKYLILSVVVGALWVCFLLFISMNVSASESDKQPEQQNHETVQDEQPEASESLAAVGEPERIAAHEQPELLEQEPEHMQDAQSSVQQDLDDSLQIEPFASGVIVGELADLLQDNVFENDGYTEESWLRYEAAVANGWVVISNFMTYTNDEVRAVIDELQVAIDGLELLPEDFTNPTDFEYTLVGLFAVVGSVAGSAFINKWQLGV